MKKGRHHTPKAIEKMRAIWTPERRMEQAVVMCGNENPAKRPAARAKMRDAWTQERRTKASDNNPMKRPEVAAKFRGDNNPMRRPEVAAKVAAILRGKKRSPEVVEKIRAGMLRLGDDHPMKRPEVAARFSISRRGKRCGEDNPMKRPEIRAKISGKNSPQWHGGISREPYAWTFNDELKEEIRRRDGHQCQLCGVSQAECKTKLPVHHIDYDKKNSDPVNLTALCGSCNARVNSNRKHWTAFFQELAVRREVTNATQHQIPHKRRAFF